MSSAEAHILTASRRRERPWLWRWLESLLWGLILAALWAQPAVAGRPEVFRGERAVPAEISSVHARFVGALHDDPRPDGVSVNHPASDPWRSATAWRR